MSAPEFKSIAPLTTDQIAQFKSDGFLVLEGVLDPAFCHQARDEMWEVIQAHLPRMNRNDPSTWVPHHRGGERRVAGAAARERR